MADVALARKNVFSALLNTWDRGDTILPLCTDAGIAIRPGATIDIPAVNAGTVNTSETGSVETVTRTRDELTINRPKFMNRELKMQEIEQLLNGNYATQIARASGGDMQNALDQDMIDYLLKEVATVAHHFNLGGDNLTDRDVNLTESSLKETDGLANSRRGQFWIGSPTWVSEIKSVADLNPADAIARAAAGGQVAMGIPMVGSLNGIPVYEHSGLPGATDAKRMQSAVTASAISSNVLTCTVASGHGFVAGQQIWTSGLDANIAVGSPATVTSVTATTVVAPLTSADDADNGTGTLYSATSMGMLVHGPWVWFGFDRPVPTPTIVKREGNAGFAYQLFAHFGRVGHSGSCKVLHAPDGV